MRLALIAMNRYRGNIGFQQIFNKFVRAVLGAAKNEYLAPLILMNQVTE